MRKLTLLVLAGFCQLVNAGESEKKPHELNEWNPLQANYKIHAGGTAYSELPTKDDSAFTVAFRDEAATQVFEQIGPDVKSVCNDTQGYRVREKKGFIARTLPVLKTPKTPITDAGLVSTCGPARETYG